jgi:hypothetical protein
MLQEGMVSFGKAELGEMSDETREHLKKLTDVIAFYEAVMEKHKAEL